MAEHHDTLQDILSILYTAKEDDAKLQRILQFLQDEIYQKPESDVWKETGLPDKYRPVVAEIAESIDAGLVCYFNPVTDELDTIPQQMLEKDWTDDRDGFKEIMKEDHGWEEAKFIDWEDSFKFEPLPSHDSFEIMKVFAEGLEGDDGLQSRLIDVLSRRRPFANFSNVIHNSNRREDWFAFKKQWLEERVARGLHYELQHRQGKNSNGY